MRTNNAYGCRPSRTTGAAAGSGGPALVVYGSSKCLGKAALGTTCAMRKQDMPWPTKTPTHQASRGGAQNGLGSDKVIKK